MKIQRIVLLGFLSLSLIACSGEGTDSDSAPIEDLPVTIDAGNYQAKLLTALSRLRADYFEHFVAAPELANNLFAVPLPDATSYFGPQPYPTSIETANCDSGSVTRDITASDELLQTINANFNFTDCSLNGRLHNGSVSLELDGDVPSRLGGQRGIVMMQFANMQIDSDVSPTVAQQLTGSFKNRSGWQGGGIAYKHEYRTEVYTETSINSELSINDAIYIQELGSDYTFEDDYYFRLSESGTLSAVSATPNQPANYTILIDPTLEYSSQLNTSNFPVYDDDIQAGSIIYSLETGESVTVTQSDTDPMFSSYTVFDGNNTFSETDAWLYPIACDDNSPMNKRDLCSTRQ